MRNELDIELGMDFIPTNETARIAVLRSRQIVKDNHEMISKLKEESNIKIEEVDAFSEAANISFEDSYTFDLYKIKSNDKLTDFIKDMFGVH